VREYRAGVSIDPDQRRARGASFGGVADAYERSRPGYPAAAVAWLAGPAPADVLDLGAGTGKLTRSLVDHGQRVTAVEPLPEMLAHLRAALPPVAALAGSAERIPLEDASVDVVTVAQAFHWFDHQPALHEIARVLRPGGVLALVWNTRDEDDPWVAALTEVIAGNAELDDDEAVRAPLAASGLFGVVETARFSHRQRLDRAALRDLVRSRSYCAVLTDEERRPVLERVDALFDANAVDGEIELPYVTRCFRARLLGT
jgi:SAM-dependent methyltransferase